jgi:hypothetical protein
MASKEFKKVGLDVVIAIRHPLFYFMPPFTTLFPERVHTSAVAKGLAEI